MLIPEAVQLVLRPAVLAHERETFVLDMGEQIKVLDLARNLMVVRIPPGRSHVHRVAPVEKLFEELAGNGEALEPAGIEKVFRVRRTEGLDVVRLADQVAALATMAALGHSQDVFDLRQIVPSFNPSVGLASEVPGGPALLPRGTIASRGSLVPALPLQVRHNPK